MHPLAMELGSFCRGKTYGKLFFFSFGQLVSPLDPIMVPVWNCHPLTQTLGLPITSHLAGHLRDTSSLPTAKGFRHMVPVCFALTTCQQGSVLLMKAIHPCTQFCLQHRIHTHSGHALQTQPRASPNIITNHPLGYGCLQQIYFNGIEKPSCSGAQLMKSWGCVHLLVPHIFHPHPAHIIPLPTSDTDGSARLQNNSPFNWRKTRERHSDNNFRSALFPVEPQSFHSQNLGWPALGTDCYKNGPPCGFAAPSSSPWAHRGGTQQCVRGTERVTGAATGGWIIMKLWRGNMSQRKARFSVECFIYRRVLKLRMPMRELTCALVT